MNRVKGEHIRESQDGFDKIREYFREEVEIRDKETKKMETKLQRAFAFIKNSFGDGQEAAFIYYRDNRKSGTCRFYCTKWLSGLF